MLLCLATVTCLFKRWDCDKGIRLDLICEEGEIKGAILTSVSQSNTPELPGDIESADLHSDKQVLSDYFLSRPP